MMYNAHFMQSNRWNPETTLEFYSRPICCPYEQSLSIVWLYLGYCIIIIQ